MSAFPALTSLALADRGRKREASPELAGERADNIDARHRHQFRELVQRDLGLLWPPPPRAIPFVPVDRCR